MLNLHHAMINMSSNMDEPINRLKVVLAEKNRTNRWLAKQLGKSEITVCRWAQNKVQPSLDQLVEIAKILDIDVKVLINNTKD